MTRAEPASWTVRPLSVHVPPGERRNPVVVVRTAVRLSSHPPFASVVRIRSRYGTSATRARCRTR